MGKPVANITIPINLVIRLIEGRAQQGWTLMSEELTSRRRGSVSYRRILRFDANGTYWEARYGLTSIPGHATEYTVCDGTLADQFLTLPSDHMLELYRVEAQNVTTVSYLPTGDLERRYDVHSYEASDVRRDTPTI